MTIKEQLTRELKKVLIELNLLEIEPSVTYPTDPKFGDYATNVALIAAKKLSKNPRELAQEIINSGKWQMVYGKWLEKMEVAGPGFINFFIKKEALLDIIATSVSVAIPKTGEGKKVMVEFAHPNTHKAFHIGHLRNITTGESIVRLLEAVGVKVIRANYQGDVGMHIAKAIYGLTMLVGEDKVDTKDLIVKDYSNDIDRVLNTIKSLNSKNIHERIAILGQAYAYGSELYEKHGVDQAAINQIKKINSSIYNDDWGAYQPYKEVYEITRQWSLEYFDLIYKRVDTRFDHFYFESQVFGAGKKLVKEALNKGKSIFKESDGAIIFPGSQYGLHDRVFITSEGNPTYEGKEMGLGQLQFFGEYKPDQIIHVVGPEQAGYFQVVFEALAQLFPETRGKEQHLIYGWVKLKEGKMSSRLGNVILGEWLLDEAKKKIGESYNTSDDVAEQVAVGAVKYSFLKVGLSQEIAFDLNESISLDGNSGPYLQYTFARTQSVLAKSQITGSKSQKLESGNYKLEIEERDLLRLLVRFPEIVEEAAERLSPSILCTYLFETAQAFNFFYQKCSILKPERVDDVEAVRNFRLALTSSAGEVVKKGLNLLGIQAPKKM